MNNENPLSRLVKMGLRSCCVALTAVLIIACQTMEKPFRKMTDEELIAYNSTVPLEQNVICFKDLRTDSHIRKTRCMTIMDILTEAETNARTIDALNIGPQLF